MQVLRTSGVLSNFPIWTGSLHVRAGLFCHRGVPPAGDGTFFAAPVREQLLLAWSIAVGAVSRCCVEYLNHGEVSLHLVQSGKVQESRAMNACPRLASARASASPGALASGWPGCSAASHRPCDPHAPAHDGSAHTTRPVATSPSSGHSCNRYGIPVQPSGGPPSIARLAFC